MNAYDVLEWILWTEYRVDLDLTVIFSSVLGLVTSVVVFLMRLVLNWRKESRDTLMTLSQSVVALGSEVSDLRKEVKVSREEQIEANLRHEQTAKSIENIERFVTDSIYASRR